MMNGHAVFKKTFVAIVAAAVITVGASVTRPFGAEGTGVEDQSILRDAQIDPATLAIIERACQNCHSQKTQLPWYGHVAPISWMLARDVHKARLQLDLSRWQDYSADERLSLLSAIGAAVRNGEMPLHRYLLLHPEARLSAADQQQIYRWTKTERSRLRASESTSDSRP